MSYCAELLLTNHETTQRSCAITLCLCLLCFLCLFLDTNCQPSSSPQDWKSSGQALPRLHKTFKLCASRVARTLHNCVFHSCATSLCSQRASCPLLLFCIAPSTSPIMLVMPLPSAPAVILPNFFLLFFFLLLPLPSFSNFVVESKSLQIYQWRPCTHPHLKNTTTTVINSYHRAHAARFVITALQDLQANLLPRPRRTVNCSNLSSIIQPGADLNDAMTSQFSSVDIEHGSSHSA